MSRRNRRAQKTTERPKKRKRKRPKNSKSCLKSKGRHFWKPKKPDQPLTIRRESEEEGELESEGDEEETAEQRAERKRREKEEAKKQKKLAEQREKRFKRMQAFVARSGAQEWEDTENSGNPEEGVGDEPKGNNDFYKSYYEEEEKLKEEEEKAEFLAEVAAEEAAKRAKEAAEKRVKEAAEKAAKYIKKRKTKAKPTEEKSFAQFAKKCEAEGLLESKPPEEGSKDEASKAAKGSRTASPLPANFNPEANLSNMSKEQADKHQEEMLTWQDRWHQNKKVQNVVKQSRIMSKVKAGIKIKLNPTSEEGVPSPGGGEGDDKSNPPPDAPPTEETPDLEALKKHGIVPKEELKKMVTGAGEASVQSGSSSKANLPEIAGSMAEYAKLVAKGTEEENKVESAAESSEEEEGDDPLWGAIMGK